MKLYSIILALAACAVAAPLVPVSNQSSNITDANPNSIETLLSNVYNATNATEERAVAAEQILRSARLDVVSSEGFEKLKNAEHYAKLAREAADAAIAASDRAAAATQEMAEISKANPSPSSSDAVARALAAADRANQAKIRAIRASEQTQDLHDERKRIDENYGFGLQLISWSITSPFGYMFDRVMSAKPFIPSFAPQPPEKPSGAVESNDAAQKPDAEPQKSSTTPEPPNTPVASNAAPQEPPTAPETPLITPETPIVASEPPNTPVASDAAPETTTAAPTTTPTTTWQRITNFFRWNRNNNPSAEPVAASSEDKAKFRTAVAITAISGFLGYLYMQYAKDAARRRLDAVNATLIASASKLTTISSPIVY